MLQQEGVKKIAMESTGIYWIPVWNILEEAWFDLMYHGFGLTDQEYLKTDYKGSKVKKSEISNQPATLKAWLIFNQFVCSLVLR